MRRPMSDACLMFVLHVRGVNASEVSALAGSLLVSGCLWALRVGLQVNLETTK